MVSIIERLFVADYDKKLIHKWDSGYAGSAYRHRKQWLIGWVALFMVSFLVIAVGYSLGQGGSFGASLQEFILQPSTGYGVLVYLGMGSLITVPLWWAVGQYGGNTKAVVIDYYQRELAHYKERMTHLSQLVAPSNLRISWDKASSVIRREAFIAAYQRYSSEGKVPVEITDEFLDLLRFQDIAYEQLPKWAIARIQMHDWLYYYYQERKNHAEGYVRVLS